MSNLHSAMNDSLERFVHDMNTPASLNILVVPKLRSTVVSACLVRQNPITIRRACGACEVYGSNAKEKCK